jgi:transcriptional regulator with XRE-family HTH domain
MARAALKWNANDLARNAKVGISTVNRFEAGQAAPIPATLAAIKATFEAAGVEFTNGNAPGVRMRDWRWFLEVYKNNAAPPLPAEYFPDFESLFSRLSEIKATLTEADRVRVHCPVAATKEERELVMAIGGIPT